MKDTTSLQNKTQEVAGILFGIVLFYSWLIFKNNIKMLFFSERTVVSGSEIVTAQYWGQIDQWLGTGLILFFVIFGHYLLYSKNMSRIKK